MHPALVRTVEHSPAHMHAHSTHPTRPTQQMAGRHLDIEGLAADDLEYNYDLAGLAALRRRLAAAIHNYQGARAQYQEVCGAGWVGWGRGWTAG
jgi:hypothetical protein